MSLLSGDYRSVSTARPPPISGHLGENTVPTFGDENGDFLSTSAPGSGVHARRKTQLEIYRHFNISRTTMYTIYRRDYWRSIRKRPAPALTVDHLRLTRLNSINSKIIVLTHLN